MEIAVSSVAVAHDVEVFEIHHLTDLHMDDPDHAADALDERVKHIAETPNALWLGGGDYGSLILPSDPRFQTGLEGSVHRLPDVYVESVTERLLPIRDKCIGFGTGNHEATVAKYYHRGVGAEVASLLGVPHLYLGVRGWAVVQFRQRKRVVTLKAFQFHGWSAGRLKGRKAIQAERDLGAWAADAFFLGHDHQPYSDIWYTEEPYGSKAGWKLRHRPRSFINGGSWTYGERAPTKGKAALKPSEWPNETWADAKNFRPQPPAGPVLYVHVDMGRALTRAAGFDFEIRQRGNRHEL